MFRSMKNFLVLAAALAGLSLVTACETAIPDRTFADITFANHPQFKLNIGSIEVVSKYKPPMKEPNVEHRFPIPPLKALRQWANDRLLAKGPAGAARFTIIGASALETPLTMEKGMKSLFIYQQSHEYKVSVEAMLELFDGGGARLGYATAAASRSATVGEDATLNQREMLWHAMTEKVMNSFNETLETNIRKHLGPWLK